MMRLGYNTSGFRKLGSILDVLRTIERLGYKGVELTLDQRHFHPHFSDERDQSQLARWVASSGLDLVLNTGGRYVLSETAHEPSLVSYSAAERARFLAFAVDTIRLAPSLGSHIIMIHSGPLPIGVCPEVAFEWLALGVECLVQVAEEVDVQLAFEFHPAMFVATLRDYRALRTRIDSPALKMTLDVGHVVCTEDSPVSHVIAQCEDEIINVHLEDIRGREHIHLPIGQGDVDFEDVFQGLEAIGYTGLVNAEFNSDDLEVDECQLALETYQYLQHLN